MGACLELGAAGSFLAGAARHPGSVVGGQGAGGPCRAQILGIPAGTRAGTGTLSFPESSLGWGVWGVFQPGLGDLAGMEMLESPRRLGTLASIHVLIFRPAIFL